MSMYKQFGTDGDLEKKGIDLNYGDFIVKIARAGGGNKKFALTVEQLTKPVRRAIQTETLDEKRSNAIMREAYARAVVLEWSVRVKVDDKGKPLDPPQLAQDEDESTFIRGIEGPDGNVLPFNVENVIAVFEALPELFADIRAQSANAALFRSAGQEADAGN